MSPFWDACFRKLASQGILFLLRIFEFVRHRVSRRSAFTHLPYLLPSLSSSVASRPPRRTMCVASWKVDSSSPLAYPFSFLAGQRDGHGSTPLSLPPLRSLGTIEPGPAPKNFIPPRTRHPKGCIWSVVTQNFFTLLLVKLSQMERPPGA